MAVFDSSVLQEFKPIPLSGLESVQLMNRVDIKYIIPLTLLPRILPSAFGEYLVMEERATRTFTYKNRYFDTVEREMYRHHHQGRPSRYKIRIREYSEFQRVYLEVKHKYKGRTIKSRIKLSENGSLDQYPSIEQLPGDAIAFLAEAQPIPPHLLSGSLVNTFSRFTLIHQDMNERITIDTDIRFIHAAQKLFNISENRESVSGIAVAEIKREAGMAAGTFQTTLKQLGIRPGGMSKYCIGMAITVPGIPYNNFKPTTLKIERSSYA